MMDKALEEWWDTARNVSCAGDAYDLTRQLVRSARSEAQRNAQTDVVTTLGWLAHLIDAAKELTKAQDEIDENMARRDKCLGE